MAQVEKSNSEAAFFNYHGFPGHCCISINEEVVHGIPDKNRFLKKGDIVGIYTQKGEVVALAESSMSEEEIRDATKGYAFETRRIIMAPNTYPKKWRTKTPPPKD